MNNITSQSIRKEYDRDYAHASRLDAYLELWTARLDAYRLTGDLRKYAAENFRVTLALHVYTHRLMNEALTSHAAWTAIATAADTLSTMDPSGLLATYEDIETMRDNADRQTEWHREAYDALARAEWTTPEYVREQVDVLVEEYMNIEEIERNIPQLAN